MQDFFSKINEEQIAQRSALGSSLKFRRVLVSLSFARSILKKENGIKNRKVIDCMLRFDTEKIDNYN